MVGPIPAVKTKHGPYKSEDIKKSFSRVISSEIFERGLLFLGRCLHFWRCWFSFPLFLTSVLKQTRASQFIPIECVLQVLFCFWPGKVLQYLCRKWHLATSSWLTLGWLQMPSSSSWLTVACTACYSASIVCRMPRGMQRPKRIENKMGAKVFFWALQSGPAHGVHSRCIIYDAQLYNHVPGASEAKLPSGLVSEFSEVSFSIFLPHF